MSPAAIQLNKLHPLPSEPALQGNRRRVAFVTGAGRGIGRAIAVRLAGDGLDVAVNDISPDSLDETKTTIEKAGARSISILGDVSDSVAVEDMVAEVVAKLGYLDVMVANAGILFVAPLLESSVQDLDRVFKVNVNGTFNAYKSAAKQMIKQGTGGKLIAACSVTGLQGSPMLSIYSASKFAVRGLTQTVALELGTHGITANSYAPGAVATEMMTYSQDLLGKESVHQWIASAPAGRMATAEDVANGVSFLASRNSDYMTGQTLSLCGGMRLT